MELIKDFNSYFTGKLTLDKNTIDRYINNNELLNSSIKKGYKFIINFNCIKKIIGLGYFRLFEIILKNLLLGDMYPIVFFYYKNIETNKSKYISDYYSVCDYSNFKNKIYKLLIPIYNKVIESIIIKSDRECYINSLKKNIKLLIKFQNPSIKYVLGNNRKQLNTCLRDLFVHTIFTINKNSFKIFKYIIRNFITFNIKIDNDIEVIKNLITKNFDFDSYKIYFKYLKVNNLNVNDYTINLSLVEIDIKNIKYLLQIEKQGIIKVKYDINKIIVKKLYEDNYIVSDILNLINNYNPAKFDSIKNETLLDLTTESKFDILETLLFILGKRIINYFNDNNNIGCSLFALFNSNFVSNKIINLWFNISLEYNFILFVNPSIKFRSFNLARNTVYHNKKFNIKYYITEKEINNIFKDKDDIVKNIEKDNRSEILVFIIENFDLNNLDKDKIDEESLGVYYNKIIDKINN